MLAAIPRVTNENVLVGFDTADDAGVYKLTPELALVQTVDFFTPIVDDPYTFGAIAAANSLSDVYAMGGKPISALSLLAYPANGDLDDLEQILKGGANKIHESGCVILGGGSPKNFALQTEPQIQEVLGIDERGHDYFLQVTDARPDTGGLSGATPGEAVSWGKVDPERLPDAVVCYLDTTVALPIITAYALAKHKPRPPRRLYDRREEFMQLLLKEYRKSKRK